MPWMLCSVGVLQLVLAAPPGSAAPPQVAPQGRTVYVTAVDKAGAAAPGLTAADFLVKIGGKAREILHVEPATAPLRIALIVDDNGSGIFRYPVGKFIERLFGRAEFAISKVAGQTQRMVDYTSDGRELSEVVALLGPRPETADGGQLLEGIAETAREFEKRRAARGIIVALTVGGEEHSTLPAQYVLDQLRKSGAALHVVSVSASAVRSRVAVQKPGALLGENLSLSEVLGEGPKQSGGSANEIVATTGVVSGLQQLAQTLLHSQYAVSYSQRDGEKLSDKVSVSVKVPGIRVVAPTRIPDK
ncbi:MAG: hypothetical protein M3545_19260 [Acidobacteriota bacterium]|nr:hypothetical protein [Acidobacteriota bacterium]